MMDLNDASRRSLWAVGAVLLALFAEVSSADEPQLAPEAATGARLERLEGAVEALAAELERLQYEEAAAAVDLVRVGLGPAAAKVYAVREGVSVGGYGDVEFVRPDREREDGTPSGEGATTDLHRLILYLGYKFTPTLLFNSEIEFEHVDEVEVEFAYVDWLPTAWFGLRAGNLLVPMGWVNEYHEPTAYLSVERPAVERQLLPSTWHENGVLIHGSAGDVTWRGGLLSALDATGFSAAGLRGGRRGGGKAPLEDVAGVLRIDWQPVPELTLGVAGYLGGVDQDRFENVAVETRIYEAHAQVRWQGLWFRGLAVGVDLSGAAALNEALQPATGAAVAEHMEGFYAELGYDLAHVWATFGDQLLPYVRWSIVDPQQRLPEGWARNRAQRRRYLVAGIAWKPMPQIVVKVDRVEASDPEGTGVGRWNLGLGWTF